MASRRTTYDKLQRDRAKKAKAALKQERRREKAEEAAAGPEEDGAETLEAIESTEGELSPEALLKYVEALHEQFDKGEVSFEEFEEKKADLLGRITVD